ncbi:MAG TPA: N-acetyltransferase [bacterium]|nr:N-acetyltransferase [bacterium]HPN31822.1 N-acetyltransferase [bacterium]
MKKLNLINENYIIRKAYINDIKSIQSLINPFAKNNEMLPRSLNDLIENLRDFIIIEENNKIIACGALHLTWIDIAEVRSLAIRKEYQKLGIGSIIVNKLIEEAKKLGIYKLFALTYKPEFFKKLGFKIISKDDLPKKVWTDCIKCPKFPDCDEIAVQLILANGKPANKKKVN